MARKVTCICSCSWWRYLEKLIKDESMVSGSEDSNEPGNLEGVVALSP